MVRYMKCPRCELNYIDGEKQEYCDICIKEMKGLKTDADELEEEEAAELPTELCPICGENMMHAGDKMCEECRKKSEFEESESEEEEDDEWREYLDDDETDLEEIDMSEEFGEEFAESEEEEKEEFEDEFDEEEDMEYVTGDDIYLLGDDEDDDEDDGEDDF